MVARSSSDRGDDDDDARPARRQAAPFEDELGRRPVERKVGELWHPRRPLVVRLRWS